MVTFYISSRYFEGNSANFLEYKNMTEADLVKFVSEHNGKLVMIEPSSSICTFRKVFIEPILDSTGSVKEGVFRANLNGNSVLYRTVCNIQYKQAKEALRKYKSSSCQI